MLKKEIIIFSFNFWIPSVKLSKSFANGLAINLALSINFDSSDILITLSLPSLSIFVTCLFIGTEKVFHHFVFSPRHSNCPSNSLANSFIIKW